MADNLKPHRSDYQILRRVVVDYMGRYWENFIGGVICMLLVAASTAATAQLMQPILDDVFLNKDQTMIYLVPLAIIIVFVFKGGAEFGHMMLTRRASSFIMVDLQNQLFDTILKREIVFFDHNSSGMLAARFTTEVMMVVNAVVNLLVGYVRDGLSFLFLLGVMIYQDWQLSLIVLLVFSLAYTPVLLLAKRSRNDSATQQKSMGVLNSQLVEIFSGIRMVQSYGREKEENKRMKETTTKIRNLMNNIARLQAMPRPIMEGLTGIAIAIVVYYGGQQVLSGEASPGELFSFITAMLLAYKPAKAVINLHIQLQMGLTAANNIFTLFDSPPAIKDKPNAYNLPKDDKNGWSLTFDQVDFSYDGRKKALQNMSMTIPAHQTVALVGPSGGGKSTTFNLIGRFYDPQKGRITIGKHPIQDVTLESLRAKVGYVSQDIVIFNDTIANNILFGKEDATHDDIHRVSGKAFADEFISQLPQGYDTLVGENGVLLSGGQKQRIALARALLKNAPILLLDEATAALDNESEFYIRSALHELKRHHTIVIIAHRLSTVRDADCIFVIQNGAVVESGNYQTLLGKKGVFTQLHEFQSAVETMDLKSPVGPLVAPSS